MAATTAGQLWALAGSGNGVDPSGDVRVARLAADGTWEPFGSDEGAPEGSEGFWPSLAVGGDTVVVSAFTGLVRGAGDRFVTFWQDPTAVVQPSFEVSFGQVPDAVLAVSAEEVWLPAAPEVGGSPWLVAGTTLSRHRDGAWQAIGPLGRGDTADPAVPASDGALWQASGDGLLRIAGDGWSVVADDIGGDIRSSLAAGEDGSVWTILDGDVVQVRPDGSRTPIGRPGGSRPLFAGAPLAAGPGVVWTADVDPKHGVSRLLGWDGTWAAVGVPEPYTWASQLLVAADGAVWATLDAEDAGQALARYADGEWTVDRAAARGLAQTPSGEVCSIRDPGVVCYDAAGLAAGAPVSTYPVDVKALSIAPDGSAWVLGEQVARLPTGAISAVR
jgi:hypothetical protein